MKKVNIDVLNIFTRNLISILDNMGISKKKGKDRIKDYVTYLSNNTNISKYRLKKMLTYDVKKLVTADDINKLSEALKVSYAIFFKE